MSTAYFVRLPFRIEDLRRPHLTSDEKPYRIEKTVVLSVIDYENFVTDLCVSRSFIEEHAKLCKVNENGVWHCIFAKCRNSPDGVLVMSDGRDFPMWAAYITKS